VMARFQKDFAFDCNWDGGAIVRHDHSSLNKN
jgi:hypothetical protein